jgi:hypothetical protein
MGQAKKPSTDVFEESIAEPATNLTTESYTEPSAAKKFINVTKLYVLLYEEMACSPMNSTLDFSGFYLASKTVYAETQVKLVELRTMYIGEE